MNGLIIDNFAGGGGASTGIEAALGRAVDIAINHDEQAIRMHEANHPGTVHIRNNIWQVDPLDATGGRPVDLAWFSPDCKHFSKAKGGKPREKSIRDLAWVVVHWVQRLQEHARRMGDPDWRQIIKLICIENVEEFQTWGPLCDAGMPIKDRAGETFKLWTAALRKCGGKLEFKELRACDYGAPTIRKRLFIVIRFDGQPIRWPEPTHGKPCSPDVLAGKLKPWRSAAEIIDWSIPCPSIFERQKPLAEKTLRRIAHGIMKFVVNNPAPFIVPNGTAPHVTKFRNGAIGHGIDEPLATVTANSFIKRPGGSAPLGVVAATVRRADFHCSACGEENGGTWWPTCEWCGHEQDEAAVAPFATYAQQGGANRDLADPLHTVTASNKDQNCIAAAHLVHIGNGEAPGQAPRAMDAAKPLGTVVAGGVKHHVAVAQLMAAHVEQANGGPNNANLAGRAADEPLSTIATSGSQQRLVTSNLIKLRGTSDRHLAASAASPNEPLNTISAGGIHTAEVRAFLIKYYGNESDGHGLNSPLGTVTVQDRFGLVTVQIGSEAYVIVDIGMRMLTPRELFNAQGFPPDYIIDRDATGAPITKTAQVAKCGNSVCPPLSEALVRANVPDCAADQQVAA